jgi:tetratricopeptide (TPR) repeat protein
MSDLPSSATADLSPAPAVTTPLAGTDLPEVVPAQAGRYRIEAEIAHGGMGLVLRAQDPDLGRPLAVKVLLNRHRDNPTMVHRFLDEAHVCGQLQHPGIPPIHELGKLDDGRPFFAMRLVRGHTLAELFARRASPGDDLPRFLGIFEQVCQTLAYAHSKGILHRDLKPANIMVGMFGEVQVMDWGLAKLMSQGAAPPEGGDSTIFSTRQVSDDAATQAGTVLGTPAYMPPEQARGQVDFSDAGSDVFGLGAILCELLTGKPPYVAGSPAELLAKATRGDLTETRQRLQAGGADAELAQLTLTCLEFNPGQRPANAGAVADTVAAHRMGVQQRLRQAEVERERAQIKAVEERKRRRLQLALVAALLGAVLLAAAGGLWWHYQRELRRVEEIWLAEDQQRRQERVRQLVEEALAQAQRLCGVGRFADAEAALRQAATQQEEAPQQQRDQLAEAQARTRLIARLDAIRLERANVIEGKFDTQGAARAYADTFARGGLRLAQGDVAALAAEVRRSPSRAELVAGLDDWALVSDDEALRGRLFAVARLADPDPWRDRVRDPAAWKDRSALEKLAATVRVEKQSPQILTLLAERLDELRGDAVGLLQAAHDRYPSDFWLNVRLGIALRYFRYQYEEALGHLRVALVVRPDSGAVQRLIAYVHLDLHQYEEARRYAERALRSSGGRDTAAYNLLGHVLKGEGRLDEALSAYRKALAIDPKYAWAQTNIGRVYRQQFRIEEAIAACRQAIALEPDNAGVHNNLGWVLNDAGRYEEAVVVLRKAIELDPREPWQYANLGCSLRELGRAEEALPHLRRAIELNPRLGWGYAHLGLTLEALGRPEEALLVYQRGQAADPYESRLPFELGKMLLERGLIEQALQVYRDGIRLDPTDDYNVANMVRRLGRRGRLAEATRLVEDLMKANPNNPAGHNALGVARWLQNRPEEAIVSLKKAIELKPRNASAHHMLGGIYLSQRRLDEAIGAFRQTLAGDPGHYNAWIGLGTCLEMRGEKTKALAAIQRAAKVAPNNAEVQQALGEMLLQRQDFDGAIRAFQRSIRLDPKNGPGHHNLGYALARKGRTDEAIAAYRKALEARMPWPGLTWFALGSTLTQKGQHREATMALEQAVRHRFQTPQQRAQGLLALGIQYHRQKRLDEEYRVQMGALALDPKLGRAHAQLCAIHFERGQLERALAAVQRARKLMAWSDPYLANVIAMERACTRFLSLERKWAAVRAGKVKPSTARELLDLADFCGRLKKGPLEALHFYEAGFEKDARLLGDRPSLPRQEAAYCAAEVATGSERGAARPDEKERSRLRKLARTWLTAEWQAGRTIVEKGPNLARRTVRGMLQAWQQDERLAGVRQRAALANLPDAERDAWERFWSDVEKLRQRAEELE